MGILDSDDLVNEDRKNAVQEWAERRKELGTPSAVEIASSEHTLSDDDSGKTLIFINPATVTIPASLPAGFNALLFSDSDTVTVDIGAVSVKGSEPSVGVAQNEAIYVEHVGNDVWLVVGGTA